MPNQLYSKGMVPTDFWESIKKHHHAGVHRNVKEVDFYNDKFALWIDLQSHFDNEVHGSRSFFSSDTRDGVKLLIKRNTGGSGHFTCYMFVVADALMEMLGGSLKSILY